MSNSKNDGKPAISVSQIEDALEERQNSDRRQRDQPLGSGVEDRRKGDRRKSK